MGFREDVSNSLQMDDTLALLHNSRKLFFLVLYLGAKPALRDGRFLVHRISGWTVETWVLGSWSCWQCGLIRRKWKTIPGLHLPKSPWTLSPEPSSPLFSVGFTFVLAKHSTSIASILQQEFLLVRGEMKLSLYKYTQTCFITSMMCHKAQLDWVLTMS